MNDPYPKILTPCKIGGVGLISKSYFSLINKPIVVSSFLKISKKACFFMFSFPQTFSIVIFIIIPPVRQFERLRTCIPCLTLDRPDIYQYM